MQKEIYNVYKKIKGLHFGKDEIVGVEQLGGGRVNSIFKVQTKDKIYTIKLQNNMDSTCKQAIGNEKYILKKYDKLVKYIPKVYYLDADGERLGYKYIILEYVKGNTLNNVGKENFYLAGKTLAKIHSNSSKYIGKIQQRKEINSYEDVEKYYLQYFSETMFSLCKIDKKLAESVQEFLKNKFSVSYYKNEKIALIHNDVHPLSLIHI